MDEIRDRTFSNDETIELDGKSFVDCRFDKAVLAYAGGDYPSFVNCSFGNTGWLFTGAALRTVRFLQEINAVSGGTGFLAEMFKPNQFYTE